MNNQMKRKLGILALAALLLVAIAMPVMAANKGNTAAPGKSAGAKGAGICAGLTVEQREQMQANRDARMKALVESGRLTQADYDARVALQKKMEQYRDKVTDLTASERQAKLKEYRAQALQELLKAGTITQAQYDQMSAAPGPGGRGGKGGKGMGGNRMGGMKAGACGNCPLNSNN